MKKIAITGANGIIGTVLMKNLSEYKITSLDLPDHDARDYKTLLKIFPGHDAILHLAWNTKTENYLSGRIDTDNLLMTYNVYRAAAEAGIKRVIMASSVHADNFYNWNEQGLMLPDRVPVPDSPYGANKVFMESLGRHYADNGLEVVCVRFGGVLADNAPSRGNSYDMATWLSHRDCADLITQCIDAKNIPGNFLIICGVSNNRNRIHDIANPIGWKPQDDIYKFI